MKINAIGHLVKTKPNKANSKPIQSQTKPISSSAAPAANFMFTEPLGSWRKVDVRQRKTAIGWAYQIKELLNQDAVG